MHIASPMTAFTNGIFYFRTMCFEPGPDLYYLFRSRIKCIGRWIEHPTKPGPITFEPFAITERGQKAKLPLTTAISPSITFLRLDSVVEAVIYSNEVEQPENNPMRDFPKGYELFLKKLKKEIEET
jgi:hypothetical protein